MFQIKVLKRNGHILFNNSIPQENNIKANFQNIGLLGPVLQNFSMP